MYFHEEKNIFKNVSGRQRGKARFRDQNTKNQTKNLKKGFKSYCTVLKPLRISLYVTDDAIARLYMTKMFVKYRGMVQNLVTYS